MFKNIIHITFKTLRLLLCLNHAKKFACFQNRVFMKFKVCVFQDESKNLVKYVTTVLIDNDMIVNQNDKSEIDFLKNSIELKLKEEYGNSASISVAVQA